MKKVFFVASLVGSLALASHDASATTIVVNFDSVDTSGGAVSGAPVSTYLAGYGITFGTSYPAIQPSIIPYVQAPWLFPVSSPNYFSTGGSAVFYSYDFTFSTPLDSFSFTIPGFPLFNASMGAWSATAFSASNVALSSVGNPGIYFGGSSTTYTLNGPGITDVSFSSNASDFAGMNLNVDDLVLVTTPEPITISLFGTGLVGAVAIRRRRKKSA